METSKRERVISGLESCLGDTMCHKCPYRATKDCHNQLDKDALSTLSARVLTIDEIKTRWQLNEGVFLEYLSDIYQVLYYGYVEKKETFLFVDDAADVKPYKVKYYGKRWRCWDQMPTLKQRKEARWNE